jgi:hypothetical protein
MVWMEMLLQLPLIVVLLYGYATRGQWTRQVALLYAVHVLTTMPPLFFEFESKLQVPHKYCIFGIYAPWAVMPAVMLVRFAFGNPFGPTQQRTSKSATESCSARVKSS